MKNFKKISLALSIAATLALAASVPVLGQTSTLACTASQTSALPGQTVNFTATGGNGTYVFSGNGITATTTTNNIFPASFSNNGTNVFTVSSNGQTANCSVNIQPAASNSGTLNCFPATSVISPGQSVNFLVTGGNGTFTFSGNGINTTTTSNALFPASFSTTGMNTITVSSNGQNANCVVNVQPNASTNSSLVTCVPPTAPVIVGQPATFTATGGNGTFTFSSPSLSISNPVGTSFNASFVSPGVQTVTATSNGVSATCAVNVQPAAATNGQLVCSPASQVGLVGQPVNFAASGGNGSYSWSANDLVLITPTGPTFRATYGVAGMHTVTVSSNGASANCVVTINPLSSPGLPNTGFAPVGK